MLMQVQRSGGMRCHMRLAVRLEVETWYDKETRYNRMSRHRKMRGNKTE